LRRALSFLILAALTGNVRAGILPDPTVIIHGTIGIPSSPQGFVDAYVVGLGGGLGLDWPLFHHFNLYTDLDFSSYGLDEDGYLRSQGLPLGTPVVGGETSVLYISASLRWLILPDMAIRPYAVAGVGWFQVRTDDINVDGAIQQFPTQNEMGVNAGAGADMTLGPVLRIFGELFYVAGLTQDVNIGYLAIRAGLSFDIVPDI
jgi:opacity protein-like surface antigen